MKARFKTEWQLNSAILLYLALLNDLSSNFAEAKTVKLIANETIQYITSPNYPLHYGDSVSLTWVITATSSVYNPSVYLEVKDSQLQSSLACYNDAVTIYDGVSSLSPELVSWCGSGYPITTLHSKYSTLLIVFSSDSSDNDYRGFRIAYYAKTNAKLKFVTRPYTALNYALLAIGVAIILVIVGVLCFLILSRNRERIYSLFTAGEDA
ncbi:astacin-like metalloendopeptidase [Crassostrea virginica]